MKKTLKILILTGLLAVGQAAAAATKYTGTNYTFDDGVFTFNRAYVWADFAQRVDANTLLGRIVGTTVNVKDIKEFGFYRVDAKGRGDGEMQILSGTDADGNEIRNSVIMEKGEKIGLYMKIETEKTNILGRKTTEVITYTTTSNSGISGAQTAYNRIDPDSHGDEQYFCFFTNTRLLGSHFEYYLEGEMGTDNPDGYEEFLEKVQEQLGDNEVIINTNGDKQNPINGAPLPGVLLTTIIGGGILAGRKKFHKDSKK